VKNARGTPSVAIGSYDAAPLTCGRLYHLPNNGLHLDPWMLASVRTSTGDIVADYTTHLQSSCSTSAWLSYHRYA